MNSCEYSNPCNAEAAGFNATTDCCPVPGGPVACCKLIILLGGRSLLKARKSNSSSRFFKIALEEDPQMCGDNMCLYANPCNAEAAGFNATTECCAAPRGEIACSKYLYPHRLEPKCMAYCFAFTYIAN